MESPKMGTIHLAVNLFVLAFVFTGISGDDSEEPFQCHTRYEFNATSSNSSGDVFSPFYEKGEYPNGLWCEYRITAPVGYRLKLTFVDLDIDPSDFCGQDQLVIFANDREYMLMKICGTENPGPLITDPKVRMVHLLFRTDHMSAGRGFHIHFESAPSFEYCSSGLQVCGNTKCFDPTSQKCDGVDDCGDGTDEEGCDLPPAVTECGETPIVPDTVFGRSWGQDRIIGGQEVIPGSWPWQVSLQIRNKFASHTCGGSLINAQWVVTAAHCFKGNFDAENFRIHLGKHHKYVTDTSEQIRYAERLIRWPNLTGSNFSHGVFDSTHDIALIKLNAPVRFTDYVRPVCLPSLGWDLPPGTRCYATGWGETRGSGFNDVLKQTDVSFMPKSSCYFEEKSQICVKNQKGFQATCHGDSGGPLSCKLGGKWFVMGATSFGIATNFMTGLCAMPEQRTVFMKMSDKAEWTRTMIKIYS